MADQDRRAGAARGVRPAEGRDEFNLAEFPLTLLSDRPARGIKTLEWEDQIVDKATGRPVGRKVIVTGSDAFGLPTAGDADVLFALVQLTRAANDFASRDVPFSRYELIRLLGWPDDGRSYRRLEASLNRWVGTSVYFSAWRDKETETWTAEKFHILDNVTLVSNENRRRLRARGREDLARGSFSWNKVVFRNLRAGYVSPVDSDVYFRLRSAVARRMFRYLSKHFRLRRRRDLTFDLKVFAFEKVGLSRSYRDAGQIKKELQSGLEELEAVGFLRPLPREERYARLGRGDWTITLIRPESEEAPAPPCPTPADPAAEAAPPPLPSPLAAELIARGVTPSAAGSLAAEVEEPEIRARIEAFDWLVSRRDRRVSRNPAGYLADSIRKRYAPPAGFESTADRARRLAEESSRRARIEQARREAAEAEAARLDDEDAPARDHWNALTPIEQAIVRAEALRDANTFLLARYRKLEGTGAEMESIYLEAILLDHLRRKLAAGPTTPA